MYKNSSTNDFVGGILDEIRTLGRHFIWSLLSYTLKGSLMLEHFPMNTWEWPRSPLTDTGSKRRRCCQPSCLGMPSPRKKRWLGHLVLQFQLFSRPQREMDINTKVRPPRLTLQLQKRCSRGGQGWAIQPCWKHYCWNSRLWMYL